MGHCVKRRPTAPTCLFTRPCQYSTPSSPTTHTLFFSSSLAVNALWHGPDNDISGEKGGTQLNSPVPVKGQIITQNRKNTDKDDPQIPQPDLRFVSKATKQQDERGQAPQKTPKNDLP